MRAVLAGWGVSVVPEMLVADMLHSGQLINLSPQFSLPVSLYWHCWKLDSAALDSLTQALQSAAKFALN